MSSDDLGNLGICRCCSSIGFFKSISKAYMWLGELEIYEQILKECFNIKLKPLPFTILQNTICDKCIKDLRSTYKFKKKVIMSEKAILKNSIKIMKNFKDVDVREVNDAVIIHVDEDVPSDNDMKLETEMEFLDVDKKYLDDVKDTSNEMYKQNSDKNNAVKEKVSDDDNDTMSELNDTVILHVGKHDQTDYVHDTKPNVKLEIEINEKNLKHPNTSSSEIKRFIKPGTVEEKDVNQEKKLAIRNDMTHNINIIIQNSTVLPFRYTSSRSYLCFYCPNNFTNHRLLRTHTLQHINYPNLTKHVRTQLWTKLVYVDVTDLSCKLCLKKIDNYPTLREHLANVHKIEFKDVQEGIVPFKLRDGESCECQICGNFFNNFKNLTIHLNEHYEYCTCETCGASYLSETRLLQHQRVSGHLMDPQNVIKKTYKCRCGKVFTSVYLRRKHEIYDHNMKSKFHECQQCDMKCLYASTLKRHVRSTHLKEKNNKCPVCGRGFYSKRGLREHSVVHTGEKKYTCDICLKSLGQKKSLLNHFLMHNGESRYICDICGKGFIQKPNMVYHMRKQHAEGEKKKISKKTDSVKRKFKIVTQKDLQVYKDTTGDSQYVVQKCI